MSEGLPWTVSQLAVGSRIGGYVIEEQIGQGGMAVVFRAHDEKLERQVALKVLAPVLAADEAFRQRFIRESRSAAAVDDPNIIPVFDAGESGGVLFLAMRYVRGGDVRSLLFRNGPLGAERVAGIVSSVASALDAAHAHGLVHRDVKPANMLLDERPERPAHVYLSDFGLSKEALGSVGLTGTGHFLGTVDYAAPEQIDGRPLDGRADQYALGCSAFEMLCGESPYRRDQGMAVLLAHLSEPPPRVTARNPGLPAELDAVFARVLAKSPDDRFATCGEFGVALSGALGITANQSGPGPSHTPTELVRSVAGAGLGVDDGAATVGGAGALLAGHAASAGSRGTPPTLPIMGPEFPQGTLGSGGRGGPRWAVPVASAAVAAAVVAIGFAAIALTRNSSGGSSPAPVVNSSASVSAGSSPAVLTQPARQETPSVSGTPSQPASSASSAPAVSGPDNVWIAQLAAIPFSDGTAKLQAKLASIQQQIPGAQIASSADYASLTPGYWMIYYNGSFGSGTDAVNYCFAQGRGTNNQCFGAFLSHSGSDRASRCYPSAPNDASCYRS